MILKGIQNRQGKSKEEGQLAVRVEQGWWVVVVGHDPQFWGNVESVETQIAKVNCRKGDTLLFSPREANDDHH